MKKILSILLLAFFLSGNTYAKYIEIVCTPYDEYGEDGKTKKIWFTSFKPKYVFHFDEENLKITKIGITKDIKDLNSMDISVEKQIKEVSQNLYPLYGFHTSANLSGYEDVVNVFEMIDYSGQGSYMRFGLFVSQYRLNPEQTKLIAKEMRNLSLSEFNRAREKVGSETMSMGMIKRFGGVNASCDNSEIRN
jgi:hypothetical protein